MTQAFNLAQLANNLNTSGQLDATDGLNGLVANANLASSGSPSSSTFLRGDRTWSSLGNVGKVLQVVQGQYTGNASMNGQGVSLDVVSLSITPAATSSKILLFANYVGGSNAAGGMSVYFLRNGSAIGTSPYTGTGVAGTAYWLQSRYYSDSDNQGGGAMQYLDSPSTTSAITYTVRVSNRTDSSNALRLNLNWAYTGNTVGFQHPGICFITAMEIGA